MAGLELVLRAVAPKANASFVRESAKCAGEIMERHGFVTARAQAELLAELAHESAGFTRFEESLNYSAKRLRQVWPSRFPDDAIAAKYANKPRELANLVYNGRMGNRKGSDDGWNYRGSGALQHTGASEFRRVHNRTGVDVIAKPTRLRDPALDTVLVWEAACTYLVDRKLVAPAIAGNTVAVRKGINGGTIGLEDVKILVARAERALGGAAVMADKKTATIAAEKTTEEKSREARSRAETATVAVPAGSAAGAAAGKGAAGPWSDGIAPAIAIGIAIAIAAVFLWRHAAAAKAKLETQNLLTVMQRASF